MPRCASLLKTASSLPVRILAIGYTDRHCPGEPPIYHSHFRPAVSFRRWIADAVMLLLPELYHQDDLDAWFIPAESHYHMDDQGDRLKPGFADDPIDPAYYAASENACLSPECPCENRDYVPYHDYGDDASPTPPTLEDGYDPCILQPQIYPPHAL